jgi:predicted DNA-binding ribbon-helix-helix protein
MCEIFAGQDPNNYQPVTRHLRLNGQSTSIRLERSFWVIVDEIAQKEGLSTPAFVSLIHSEVLELRGEATNFTSLLRCACLIRQEQIAQVAQIARGEIARGEEAIAAE